MRLRRLVSCRPRGVGIALAATLGTLLTLSGCGGDDEQPAVATGLTADFTPSPTAPAANRVRLEKVGATGDIVTIAAVLDGPTTSNEIRGFAFDLVLTPPTGSFLTAQLVDNSAAPGNALTGSVTAIVEQPAVPGDRVVIGVSKLGSGNPCTGDGLPAGEKTILQLSFKLSSIATTTVAIAASQSQSAPAAIDCQQAIIPSILFDTQTATLKAN